MLRFPILAVFGILLLGALRQTTSAVPDGVRELAPGVYFWQGDRTRLQQSNSGWIVFNDYVLVIDANFPWGAREILAAVKRTTDKPIRFVFDTHYHSDHTFGNSVFVDAGASLICSEACAAELRKNGPPEWQRFVPTGVSGERLVGDRYRIAGYRLEFPTVLFGEKMILDDGRQRVELIRLGPAHTAGDAVAYLPASRILFSGDLCVNWTRGNNVSDANADMDNWIRVLDALAAWKVDVIVPGHGTIGNLNTLAQQRAYLAAIWQAVQQAVRDGKPAEQLAKELDLSRHQPFGADPRFNSGAIRAMYRKLTR